MPSLSMSGFLALYKQKNTASLPVSTGTLVLMVSASGKRELSTDTKLFTVSVCLRGVDRQKFMTTGHY